MRHPIRIAAPIAAVLVAASGCASNPTSPRAATSPSVSPNVSTPAPAGAGAGSSAPPAASGSGRPAPAPTTTPTAKPIPDDPAKAVAQWLAAINAGDYQTQLAGSADAARVLTVVRDIIQQENAHRGASTNNSMRISEAPKTIETSGDTARVSGRAVNHSVVSGPKGTIPEDTSFDGPYVLKKVAGKWRITDFVYAGAQLSPTYYAVNATQAKQGFVLTVGAFVSYKGTTAAVIRFTRESGGEPMPLRVDKASLFAKDGSEHAMTQLAFEYPKRSPAGFVGFGRIDGKPLSLHIEVSDDATPPNTWLYDIDF